MKKALIIGLVGLLCAAFIASLPKDMSGPPEVSAYPAPNGITMTFTNYAESNSIYIPILLGKMPTHGVGLTSFMSDYEFIGAEWFFDWMISTPQIVAYPRNYVPMSKFSRVFTSTPVSTSAPTPTNDGTRLTLISQNYSGYILLFNEPGSRRVPGSGSDCIMAKEAAYNYRDALMAYPNAKFVVGGMFSWDSVTSSGDDAEARTDCTKEDPHWRKHFIQELGALNIPPPRYWHIHGYVYTNIAKADTVNDILRDWKENMSPAMTTNIINWFNAASTGVDIDSSYKPVYWITEYNSLKNNSEGGPSEFAELMDWVDVTIKTQAYPLERAAVFNLRCSASSSWCVGFEDTNLLQYASGTPEVKIATTRGAHFMGIVSGSITSIPPSLQYMPTEEEIQALTPYPFSDQ